MYVNAYGFSETSEKNTRTCFTANVKNSLNKNIYYKPAFIINIISVYVIVQKSVNVRDSILRGNL